MIMKRFVTFLPVLLMILACNSAECVDSCLDFPTDQMQPVVHEDISNQRVSSFVEDELGHIWIGTYRGLNKFTSGEYYQYFSVDDSLGLPDNQISQLYRDSRDRLWVGTVNGISRYTENDSFKKIPLESSSSNVIQIFENLSGRLFVNTANSLCVYDPKTDTFEEELKIGRTPFLANTCFIAPNNDLWVVTSVDMKRYCSLTMELKDSLSIHNYPTYSYMSEEGYLWLSGNEETLIYDTKINDFVELPSSLNNHPRFKGAHISGIYPYGTSSLILNTDRNGLFLYNYIEDVTTHHTDAGFPFEAPSFRINTIFTDSNQNIWFGSYDQGISVRYSYKKKFNNDSYLSTLTQNKSVMSVDCDSQGNLWILTLQDGLMRYNVKDHTLVTIYPKDVFRFEGGKNIDFTTVFVDSEDNVWLLTAFGAVKCRWNGRALSIRNSYFVFMPLTIAEDKAGTVWVGTGSEYLYSIAPGAEQTEVMKPLISNYTFMPAIGFLPDGNMLLAAFQQKIKEIDQETRTVTDAEVSHDSWIRSINNSHFIPTCMHVDDDGVVWIGTMANGLLRYDHRTGEIVHVEGTPCADICSIEEDVHGNLWVSTQYGLGKYDRTTGKFINWFEADGIGGNQFYDRASCVLPNGSLVFGGTHGLTYFDPIDVTVSVEVPFRFERLTVNNQPVVPVADGCIDVALPYKPDILLENWQNNFSISFAAIDYSEFERVQYQYKLEGYDDYWIETPNNVREAYYANVPAGKYEFKVRVTNNEETMVLAEDSLMVTIGQPFWLSWWAILVYAVIIAFVGLTVVKIRDKLALEKNAKLKAQREKEQEKKINEMNMSFFANISHEFRTPLTMISGPVNQLVEDDDISADNRRLLAMVQRNTRRMLRLVNQLLDFNKLENGQLKLQVKQIDVIAQLRNLTDIYKVTAEEKGVSFKTWGLEESLMVWVDDDKLDKICFNLLSNAMKFTSAGGKVEFGIDVISRDEAMNHFALTTDDVDTRYLKIVIKDSGPGIPEEQRERIFERYYQLDNHIRGSYNWGTGIGLFFAKTLAELHHGHLKAGDRDEGPGAQFTLLLPASESAYADDEKNLQGGADITFVQSSVKYQEIPEKSSNEDLPKALVVDDDVDVTRYLKELLSPYYKVITKHDADSAFVTMKEEAPDVVLSDVMMPGKTGYEFCRQIKENIQLSHIPVILVTAKVGVDAQVEGLGVGADAYVTKPFEPKFLLAQIDSLLKNREKLRARLSESTDVESLEENSLSPQDSAFMTELYQLMENELSNSELDVARMTEMLHISRTKFYYKVKGLTGENPSVFFKRYKLNRAAQLMKDRRYNISEIADMTGFSTLSHFSTSFKKQFGVSPSEYMK